MHASCAYLLFQGIAINGIVAGARGNCPQNFGCQ